MFEQNFFAELLILGILGLAVLLGLFTWFMESSRPKSKKIRRVANQITGTPKVESIVRTQTYDIPQAQQAIQIIQSWFPHNDTEPLAGAPVKVFGSLSKELNYNQGTGQVRFLIYYNVGMRMASAVFLIHVREIGAQQTEIKFEWDGADIALTDMFSPDYKVLKYLMNRVQAEFLQRNYKSLSVQSNQTLHTPPALASASTAPKTWWREFSASPGGRVYAHWPNPQDYLESVQSPKLNFKDAGLQDCVVTESAMGIPIVTSGMFASVYEFRNESERWAVRCFTTRLKDQQERYRAISSFILADDLPYTVDFHYIEDGIKCGETWYPILKMNWVEGEGLDAYIGRNILEKDVLNHLRAAFQLMMERMRFNGVAHGDLQHGNILISNGEIYLVDYDGFFVPELLGRFNNELGHRNYQHPERSDKHFGPYLDNFAAHLIDFTLLCLIHDPSLWKEFDGGDECLLFRRNDLKLPGQSKLVSVLRNHESEEIRKGMAHLLELLAMPVEDVPYLGLEDSGTAINIKKEIEVQ